MYKKFLLIGTLFLITSSCSQNQAQVSSVCVSSDISENWYYNPCVKRAANINVS